MDTMEKVQESETCLPNDCDDSSKDYDDYSYLVGDTNTENTETILKHPLVMGLQNDIRSLQEQLKSTKSVCELLQSQLMQNMFCKRFRRRRKAAATEKA
jgi:hypothetical protein